MIYSYWAWFGTIQLLIATWKDYRNNMNIDDRHNYFMLGVTISLLSHISRGLMYTLALFIMIILLNLIMNRFKGFGAGDNNTLTWIFLGFGLINVFKLAWFTVVFALGAAFFSFMKNKIFKHKPPVPFYAVILILFVANNILFGLY